MHILGNILKLLIFSVSAIFFVNVISERYDRKQQGFGGQSKPILRKKAKTTKKLVLRMECSVCKWKNQVSSWRKEMRENVTKPISGAHQEDQTFRAGRREEEEGTDDPVLTSLTCPCPSVKARSYHM